MCGEVSILTLGLFICQLKPRYWKTRLYYLKQDAPKSFCVVRLKSVFSLWLSAFQVRGQGWSRCITPRRPTATPSEGPVRSIAIRAREERGVTGVQVLPPSLEPTVAPADPTAQNTFSSAAETEYSVSDVPEGVGIHAPFSLRRIVPFSPVAIRMPDLDRASP